jgi:hypothetical protein
MDDAVGIATNPQNLSAGWAPRRRVPAMLFQVRAIDTF